MLAGMTGAAFPKALEIHVRIVGSKKLPRQGVVVRDPELGAVFGEPKIQTAEGVQLQTEESGKVIGVVKLREKPDRVRAFGVVPRHKAPNSLGDNMAPPLLASIIAEVQEKRNLRIVYLARAAVFAPVFIGLFDGLPGFCSDGYAFKPKRKLIFKIAQDR